MSETVLAKHKLIPEKSWLLDLQESQRQDFLVRGYPSRREEHWKYTDMTALAKMNYAVPAAITPNKNILNSLDRDAIKLVFVNGVISVELSELNALPSNVILCSINEALVSHEALIRNTIKAYDAQKYPFACFNNAFLTGGAFLFIPKSITVEKTIHCVFLNTQQNQFLNCPRNIFLAGENSSVSIIEEYVGWEAENYLTAAVTDVYLGKNARVSYFKIQSEAASATHVATTFITQEQDSSIKTFSLAAGGKLAREDIHVFLEKTGAECKLNGFYHLKNDLQHIDNHVYVNHLAERGASSMLYKGILQKKSKAVFNGKVYVEKNAQKNSAHQENHNLLLANDAEINTKPELEIYADDIKCTHGATIGQLDAESLFYLRARGISEQDAKSLLTEAFAEEAFAKIEDIAIREYIQQRNAAN